MNIWQSTLNGPGQCCDAQLLHGIVPTPSIARDIGADKLGGDGAHVRMLVDVVVLVLLQRLDDLIQRSLSRLGAWRFARNRRNWLIVVRLLTP